MPQLLAPSSHSRQRLHSIPFLFDTSVRSAAIFGRIDYDSWAELAPGLRNSEDGHIRRMRFNAGKISIEIVAERRESGWEFIARIYSENSVVHEYVLNVGNKRLLAQADGFYHWTSKSLLQRIQIVSPDQHIEFGGIKW